MNRKIKIISDECESKVKLAGREILINGIYRLLNDKDLSEIIEDIDKIIKGKITEIIEKNDVNVISGSDYCYYNTGEFDDAYVMGIISKVSPSTAFDASKQIDTIILKLELGYRSNLVDYDSKLVPAITHEECKAYSFLIMNVGEERLTDVIQNIFKEKCSDLLSFINDYYLSTLTLI